MQAPPAATVPLSVSTIRLRSLVLLWRSRPEGTLPWLNRPQCRAFDEAVTRPELGSGPFVDDMQALQRAGRLPPAIVFSRQRHAWLREDIEALRADRPVPERDIEAERRRWLSREELAG